MHKLPQGTQADELRDFLLANYCPPDEDIDPERFFLWLCLASVPFSLYFTKRTSCL